MGRWCASTRVGYGVALDQFADSFKVQSADVLVARILSGELDVYVALERYLSDLAGKGLAPKTIRGYLTAVKGFLRHENVTVDDYQVRLKVGVPPNIESSLDRIPTREELRILVLDTNPRTRALISLLASSGLRIGEAANLHISNLDLLKNKITVMATRSKSRQTRITFISPETAKFLADYLRRRLDNKTDWVFPDPRNPAKPAGRGALYMLIIRALIKAGLRRKLDPDSRMYELHPHAFRKYFFTKLISAGVDRGIAEYLMGHHFGLDNAYLRMAEDRLRKEYAKAEADFTFLTENNKQEDEEISSLRDQIRELRLAVRMLQDASGLKAGTPSLSPVGRIVARATSTD